MSSSCFHAFIRKIYLNFPYLLRDKYCSQQVTELNEKLNECYRKLREAEAETRETQREIKLKEVIATLQRIFPAGAVKGRVSDLCKPTQRKYDKAISVVLGKNIDSIVVDTQQTAMECVNVRNASMSIDTWALLD